jgi:hypothetical protein
MIPKVKQKALASSLEKSLLKRLVRNLERKARHLGSLQNKARKVMPKARAKSPGRWQAMNPDNPRAANSLGNLQARE